MNRSIPIVFVLIFLTASCLIIIQPVKASADSWVTKAPMATARIGPGVAVVNGKIYALGGEFKNSATERTGGLLNSIEEYDPNTNTWTTKAPMPTPKDGFAITSYGNKIYVFGGWNGTTTINGIPILTRTTETYDPATDTWANKAPLPTPRSALNAEVVDGKIYLIGGFLGNTEATGQPGPDVSNATDVYDPLSDSWTTVATMPTAVYGYASAVVDNKIYIEGGEASGFAVGTLNQIYDPEMNMWTLGKPLPAAIRAADAGATTGAFAPARLYVIGGTTNTYDGISTVQVYDPQVNNWTLGDPMPTPRLGLSVTALNDTFYAIGGLSSAGPENIVGTVYAVNEQYFPLGYGEYTPLPTLSPSSSPSTKVTPSPSIPEFPSFMVVSFLTIGITSGAIIFKRKQFKRT